MAHAEKCPICNGTGETKGNKKVLGPCYGCNGKGWVEISDSFPPVLPNTPTIPSLPQPYSPPEWPSIPPRYYPYHYWSGKDTFFGPSPTLYR